MGKGGDFEREISKQLTVWLTGVEKPYKFWRMPGSGMMATIHEDCANMSGDIRSLGSDSAFLTDIFSVECKNGYPKTSFWQLFKHIKGFNIRLFWEQCLNDAAKGDKRPMLIYRKKGNPVIVGFSVEDSYLMRTRCAAFERLPFQQIHFDNGDPIDVIFHNWVEFLECVTPEHIRQVFKK